MTEQDYLQRIHELEKQVSRLQTELKKNSETQYGLRWMDVPEAFEAEAENAIPTLEEVPGKAISNDDGKPTHILIEGDNFHALSCLNYTHKGQIDVIYIDPPYNTGSDGFVYKDKRVLDKFPDGTTVPTDHPLRHSYWLSFMHKRLEVAKNLLSDRGVIFISIDDNEQANLKLLCDQVFGKKNFVCNFIWQSTPGSNTGVDVKTVTEFVMMYAKNSSNLHVNQQKIDDVDKYKNEDEYVKFRGKYLLNKLDRRMTGAHYSEALNYPIEVSPGVFIYPGGQNVKQEHWNWRWSEEKVRWGIENGFIVFKEGTAGWTIYFKQYLNVNNNNELINRALPYQNLIKDIDGLNAARGTQEVMEILSKKAFDYPKPLSLLLHLLKCVSHPSSTILDFFGGSGTTMHATMQLNEEDGGHRQCILVQQNENNICEAVTYERNKRVMQGYTNAKGEAVAGLGNSMKYYRTAFVGEHKITDITDADKVALTQKAGCLLALGENTLEEIRTAKSYQIFQLRKGDKPTNDFGYTAVYFSGNLLQFADFRREIEQIQAANPLTRIAVYVFTWGDPSIFENEFDDLSGITIKPIPQPILEIYQNIHQL